MKILLLTGGSILLQITVQLQIQANLGEILYIFSYVEYADSHKEDEYAKCNSCRIDISVARGGKNDVTKHVTSAEKRNQRITSFVVKGPEESDKLIYAETKFAIY